MKALGALLWLAFLTLATSGAALAVAEVHALWDRRRAPAALDAAAFRAGRWRQLRRYGACWALAAALWLLGVMLASRHTA